MLLKESYDLGRAYKQYFEIVPALSNALKDEVFRVRHQVFCEELNFEAERPDRRESDEYDSHALHVLIRSIKTGGFIGCTRVILSRPSDPFYPLPIEKICKDVLDRSIVDSSKLPRDKICEASRLAVVSQFRRRAGENKSAFGVTDQDYVDSEQPRFPYIPISLSLASIEIARLHGITTMFMLTEERLTSFYRKIGWEPQTIGGVVLHRGARIPAMMSPPTIVKNLRPILRPLYQVIAAEVANSSLR